VGFTVRCLFSTFNNGWRLRLHPESAEADRLRTLQIRQILSVADAEQGTVMIAGDLNAGPGVSDGNFRSILELGL